jgi:hypothetical protein
LAWSLLSELFPQASGPFNVPLLRSFVAATQQQQHSLSSACEIQSIPWTEVDSHFTKTASKTLHITQVSQASRLYARHDSRLALSVTKASKPSRKDVCLLNLEHDALYPNGYAPSSERKRYRAVFVERAQHMAVKCAFYRSRGRCNELLYVRLPDTRTAPSMEYAEHDDSSWLRQKEY